MKNRFTNRMPEDSCSREVAGGSLWTGKVFGLFVLKGGDAMKMIAILFILIFGGTMIYPTYPGTTIRDYRRPALKIEGNKVYQIYPGTTIRDYRRPGYVIKGNRAYPTIPGTTFREYSKPGYIIETPGAINFDDWNLCPDAAE